MDDELKKCAGARPRPMRLHAQVLRGIREREEPWLSPSREKEPRRADVEPTGPREARFDRQAALEPLSGGMAGSCARGRSEIERAGVRAPATSRDVGDPTPRQRLYLERVRDRWPAMRISDT